MSTRHYRIPDEIAALADITWEQKAILGLLARLQDEKAESHPSYKYIAEKLGITRRAAQYAVADDKTGLRRRPELVTIIWRERQSNLYSVKYQIEKVLRKRRAVEAASSKLLSFPSS